MSCDQNNIIIIITIVIITIVSATALGLAYPAARGIGAIGNGTEA